MSRIRNITFMVAVTGAAVIALTVGLGSVAGAAGAAEHSGAATAPRPAVAQADGPATPLAVQRTQARALLAEQVATHPILAGVTVEIGATPRGFQAVSFYEVGRIVISPDHHAVLPLIVVHECAHIIDWRSDGRIDRGDLPH